MSRTIPATHDASAVAAAAESRPPVAWRMLGLVLLAALVVRGGFLVVARDGLNADPDAYRLIARSLRDDGSFARPARGSSDRWVPTAYRPPLYPLVLAMLGGAQAAPPDRVLVVHLMLGCATVVLTWLLARRHLSEFAAVVAAALVALDPILLNQSAQVMTETLAAFLAVASVLLLDRFLATRQSRWAALGGVALGVAALCRPTFLPLVPVLAVAVAWRGIREWRGALFVIVIAALVVAPWVLRNRLVMGRWIATTTHGGYTLLLGNNDDFYRYLRQRSAGEVWAPVSDEQLMNDCRATVARSEWPAVTSVEAELFDDAVAYRCARATIRREPALFVRACIDRVVQFWNPLPKARSSNTATGGLVGTDRGAGGELGRESGRARAARYAVAVWYAGVYLAAGGGLWRRRHDLVDSPWLLTLLVILGFVAAHTAYWSNPRMRGPVMPLVALVAAAGVAGAQGRRSGRESFS